jgi:hypothetical protein
MTHCQSHGRFAWLACLCLFVPGCRGDAGAPDGNGRTASAPRGTPSALGAAPVTESSAKRRSADTPPATAPSAGAADVNGACAGPLPRGAALPHFEQRKLASHKEGRYRFELTYPVFVEEDEKVASNVNRQLLEQLTAVQKRFLKETRGETEAPDPDNERWFEGKCDTAFYSPSFTSIACETMEGPGAHPNIDQFAVNFQICPDVRRLALADLCRSLPECRVQIIELINQDFRTGQKKETAIQFRDGAIGAKGDAPDTERTATMLRAFGITPVGLRFFLFDELPHALKAFAIVDIPAQKVRPVLRDDVARRIWGL